MTAPAETSAAAPDDRSFATDDALLARVLAPYKDHCRYLRTAHVGTEAETVFVRAEFAIGESCYIDDTGHLNSVEANIAYNQMMYYLVAMAIGEDLLDGLKDWTLDDFWRRRLPDILIARLTGTFRRPLDPRAFSGRMDIHSVTHRTPGGRSPFLLAETSYRYWDAAGGRCDGEVTLAFVDLPGPEVSDR
ncbi:FcoT family thioesterase [Streptomyces sp. NPDC048232]|uniref:(2E)-enoyl-ACP glycyltransferase n=1 Tax=Streptomyces sp. NPDC048232 TaxID=3365520 RepID=UPI00371B5D66